MKKLLTAGVTLLSVVALVACSSNSSQSQGSSSSTEQTSSSVSEASSSASETSTSASSATTEITLLTDEEIDGAQTLGDLKTNFEKLLAGYAQYADELGQKIPASVRDSYTQQIDTMKESFETAKQQFNDSLSQMGSDTTQIPDSVHETFITMLKQSRDTMKSALESATKMIN